jgi:radical SAM/Cys-rich protein
VDNRQQHQLQRWRNERELCSITVLQATLRYELIMLDTRPLLLQSDFPPIQRTALTTLQVNLGYRCNLSCAHCHVNAGPTRTEMMTAETLANVIEFLQVQRPQFLDLTGGAPEMHEQFRQLVVIARELNITVIDRCNLTILLEPDYTDLPEFLAEHGVVITASLPCYLEDNVEKQRGKGVFNDSIEALRRLNALGYGRSDGLKLNLVYNPIGAVLPPSQVALEADYKRELLARFGVYFNQLYTITNMPISRFGAVLMSQGQYVPYMQLLRDSFSSANLNTVMCRELISVDWQGFVYDCDFNQMLDLPLIASESDRTHLRELLHSDLRNKPIRTAEHCYGCTAGQGSSCGGAIS